MRHPGSRWLAAALVVAGAAGIALSGQTRPASPTTKPAASRGTAAHGREIYESAGCALCHAVSIQQEEKDGLLRSGHPLEGAAWRGTWWQGQVITDAGDASELCLKRFIAPDAAGFAADERKALILFMQSLGDARGIGPLVLLRRDAGDVDLQAGDADRGKGVFDAACLSCHPGEPAELRRLAGNLSPAQIASVVRRGAGTMPFFQVDRLKAPQVADVAAFLDEARAPATPR